MLCIMLDSANVMLVGGGRRCQVDRSVSQQGRSVTRGSRDTRDAASSSGLIKHQPVTKVVFNIVIKLSVSGNGYS